MCTQIDLDLKWESHWLNLARRWRQQNEYAVGAIVEIEALNFPTVQCYAVLSQQSN